MGSGAKWEGSLWATRDELDLFTLALMGVRRVKSSTKLKQDTLLFALVRRSKIACAQVQKFACCDLVHYRRTLLWACDTWNHKLDVTELQLVENRSMKTGADPGILFRGGVTFAEHIGVFWGSGRSGWNSSPAPIPDILVRSQEWKPR